MLWWPGQPVIMLSHGVELSLYHLAEKTVFCLEMACFQRQTLFSSQFIKVKSF